MVQALSSTTNNFSQLAIQMSSSNRTDVTKGVTKMTVSNLKKNVVLETIQLLQGNIRSRGYQKSQIVDIQSTLATTDPRTTDFRI